MPKFPVDAPLRKVIKAFSTWGFTWCEKATTSLCYERTPMALEHLSLCPIIVG